MIHLLNYINYLAEKRLKYNLYKKRGDKTPLLIMCLYPRFIKNKRYFAYNAKRPAKGKATATECKDYRKLYVPIGCGNCYECRKQKAQQWRVRLMEELKVQKNAYFITLTFSADALNDLITNTDNKDAHVNTIAKLAVRRFLERYRKKYKKSLRHWLITELGHENSERIHLHGIIFPTKPITNEELENIWKYGMTYTGDFCNEKTINYIVKYVTKIDPDHKTYKPVILCSAGLGANFVNSPTANIYKYRPKQTPEYYTLANGQKIALPIYYRNKLFTEQERDLLWTDRLDRGEIYVNGIRIRDADTVAGQQQYYEILREQQQWNKAIGYGDTSDEWAEEFYKVTFEMLQKGRKK